jgi:methylthioribose-1-phosphate isomerase
MLALAAKYHGIPFYSAAPATTFDLAKDSKYPVIEERDSREITQIQGRQITPKDVRVFNPAFDVTPLELVTAVITDRGVFSSEQIRSMTTL